MIYCFKCKINLTFSIESQLVALVIAHALLLEMFLLADQQLSVIQHRGDCNIFLPVLSFSHHIHTSSIWYLPSPAWYRFQLSYFNCHNCAQICNAWLVCIHCISSYLTVRLSDHAFSGHCLQNTQETTANAMMSSSSRHLLTKARSHPVNRELVYIHTDYQLGVFSINTLAQWNTNPQMIPLSVNNQISNWLITTMQL